MSRALSATFAFAFCLSMMPVAQVAAQQDTPPATQTQTQTQTQKKSANKKLAYKKKYSTAGRTRSVPGYGFLPGVRTPEQIERDRARQYYASRPPWYGPAWPQFYHSRWNGGGFGPCYTQTPIGYIWNCGR